MYVTYRMISFFFSFFFFFDEKISINNKDLKYNIKQESYIRVGNPGGLGVSLLEGKTFPDLTSFITISIAGKLMCNLIKVSLQIFDLPTAKTVKNAQDSLNNMICFSTDFLERDALDNCERV